MYPLLNVTSTLRGFGGKGIRTPDLLIANETLYQLSYTPVDSSESYHSGGGFHQAKMPFSHLSLITYHDLLSRRAQSPVWHKKLLQDCVKTGIAPQGIENGTNFGFERTIVAFFYRFSSRA